MRPVGQIWKPVSAVDRLVQEPKRFCRVDGNLVSQVSEWSDGSLKALRHGVGMLAAKMAVGPSHEHTAVAVTLPCGDCLKIDAEFDGAGDEMPTQ